MIPMYDQILDVSIAFIVPQNVNFDKLYMPYLYFWYVNQIYYALFCAGCWRRSSDGWAKNQLGERRLGELFFGRQTIGRQARTVRRQQIGRFGDMFQTVGRNV